MSSGPPRPQWPQEEPAVDDAAPSANEYPGGRAKLGGTRLQFRPTNLAVHAVERRSRAIAAIRSGYRTARPNRCGRFA